MMTSTPTKRSCFYIKSGENWLFGWKHRHQLVTRPTAAIICNPLGVEYMSGHRSIRHMADGLASQGIETLRFDYAQTGDSSGGSFTQASVGGIVGDILAIVAALRSDHPDRSIALIGIGLGATFAALAARDCSAEHLILWNPTVSGKRFIREQKLLSEVLAKSDGDQSADMDVAGIVLTPKIQEEFGSINLIELDYSGLSSILLIDRADRKSNPKFVAAMASGCSLFQQECWHGYQEMMAQPTDTVVPTHVIERVGQWIRTMDTESFEQAPQRQAIQVKQDIYSDELDVPAGDHTAAPLVEIPETFGTDGQLFGIATIRRDKFETSTCRRAFVFLNCGSEHHAGPHRMYTVLARHCASFGNLSFRFDLEGIGDSFANGGNDDNCSYSPIALSDIESALKLLSTKYGCDEFTLSGICAGAYHSFRAISTLENFDIKEANLINPLVFEWDYNNPDDHVEFETHTYRSSMRDPRNWRRLISGDIDYRRLIRSFSSLLRERLRRFASSIAHRLFAKSATGMPRDMQNIEKLGRSLNLVLSQDDPGLEIMNLLAARETKAAIRRSRLTVFHLQNANHGLSKKSMQDQLINYFIEKYRPT